jgi:hypothetical protein
VATVAACVPLALRYWGRTSESTPDVRPEIPDAEPGEVVDFAPRAIIVAGSEVAQTQIRRVDTA